jgi:hypothetical protein
MCTACDDTPGPTLVSGAIISDVVWCKLDSPVIVTDNLTVVGNLTVQAGVEVRVRTAAWFKVQGHLEVAGNAIDRVTFTTDEAIKTVGAWSGIDIVNTEGGSAALSYAVVEYAATGLQVQCCDSGGPIAITESEFRHNRTVFGGYSGSSVPVQVTDSIFHDNETVAPHADRIFRRCDFYDNGVVLNQTERTDVFDSIVRSNGNALQIRYGRVENTQIVDNDIGVSFETAGVNLVHNSIAHNRIGIQGPTDGSTTVSDNNICDNTELDLEVRSSESLDATNNYWCTTLPEAIEARTRDLRDDVSLGILTYFPFRTEAVPEAPAL